MKKLTKYKRLFLAIATLFTPLLVAAVSPGKITFSSGVYGPLTIRTEYWDFQGFLRWNKTSATVYESFTVTNRSNQDTYTVETEPHYMAANASCNVDVHLNLFHYTGSNGTDFVIGVIDADTGGTKYTVNFTLYMAGHDVVAMNNYVTKYYTAKPVAFMLNTLVSKVTFYSERVRFDGYCDYLQTDSYYRFKFYNFEFYYSFLQDYEDDDGKIYFMDIYNLFPNISKDKSGRSFIPVVTTANGPYVTIDLGELFVNPSTLDMSTSQLPGYVPTNYFYFPMRAQAKILEYEFKGYVLGVGPGNSEYYFPLSVVETPSFFGDCIHSDYCVEEELV